MCGTVRLMTGGRGFQPESGGGGYNWDFTLLEYGCLIYTKEVPFIDYSGNNVPLRKSKWWCARNL